MHRLWPVAQLFAAAVTAASIGCTPAPLLPNASPAYTQPAASATVAPGTSNRSPALSPEATADTLPAAVRAAIADSGAIVVANIEPEASGWWILTLNVVRPGEAIVSGSLRIRGDGWKPLGNDHPDPEDPFDILTGSVRLTREGWAAVEVRALRGGISVVVLDVFGERDQSLVIQGHAPVWLPDGTLLLSGGARTSSPHDHAIRRATEFGFGEILDTVVPAGTATPSYPLNYIVDGDLDGIQAWVDHGDDWGGVTIRWDGTVVDRKREDPAYLALGSERGVGADGSRILGCSGLEEACAVAWQRRDGTVLTLAGRAGEVVWTRDGSRVVVLDYGSGTDSEDSSVYSVRDTGKELVPEPLAPVEPGELDGGLFFFRGVSDWAVALERDSDLHVNVIPLDGSPVIGPLVGTVALVNP